MNDYAAVFTLGADRVTVDDASSFSAGDTVMLMQMKGVTINTIASSSDFGTLQSVEGIPGQFEFLIVQSVSAPEVIFRNNIINAYDLDGGIQLIRVPGYENALVEGMLTCEPWDSATGKGGVLAIFVDNQLELQADIDVRGKGFKGGKPDAWIGDCVDVDPARYNKYASPADSLVSGYKGEGIANLGVAGFSDKIYKARNTLYNGGGGGNGRFAGGGGGGNMGGGSSGGSQDGSCGFGFSAYGLGGLKIDLANIPDGLHPGGGGGTGNQETPGNGSAGANGGGVVILVAKKLTGNGYTIHSTGANVQDTVRNPAGAGGGGAGGSVGLYVDDYNGSLLNINAMGGTGGATAFSRGYGGGGGGGLIWYKGSSLPGNVVTDVTGGKNGVINADVLPTHPGIPGDDGELRNNLEVTLNGFLFNTIYSRTTLSLVDTICEGDVHDTIMGTTPIGGTLPYTYTWEYSFDKSSWNTLTGEDKLYYYTVNPQADTIYYRRIIEDNTLPTAIIDVSKVMEVYVHPEITNNRVTYDTLICRNQQPLDFGSLIGPPEGGIGTYTYLWEESTDETNWVPASGTNSLETYDPPVLTDTTYYRRWVYSGKCALVSDTIPIHVLPLITDNVLTADQVICQGSLFDPLDGETPGGGDLVSYTYVWEQSADNVSWEAAYGTGDQEDYAPDTTSVLFPGTAYFRRTVYSGEDDVCSSVSNVISLTDWPKLEDNEIGSDQTICETGTPAAFTGLTPGGGNNSYAYIWQDSLSGGSWSDISTATAVNYSASALTDSTWFRRVVSSSVCADTSLPVVVNVHPLIGQNVPAFLSGAVDTILCDGGDPNLLEGGTPVGGDGSYAYDWQQSVDGSSWASAAGTADQVNYDPSALNDTTYYKRIVTSGMCTDESPVNTVYVLPLLSNYNVSADQTVCYNTSPAVLDGPDAEGGDGSYSYLWESSTDGTNWTPAAGTHTTASYQPEALTLETFFKRQISSGFANTCTDYSNIITIGIHDLPTGVVTALEDTLCAGETGSFEITLTGASPFSLQYSDGSTGTDLNNQSNLVLTPDVTPAATATYTLTSVVDDNGCVATDLSGSAIFTVYEVPVAAVVPAAALDSVCGLEYRLDASPSVGNGEWLSYEVSPAYQATVGSGQDSIRLSAFTSENDTYDFYWKETNWQCVDSTVLTVVFSQPPSAAVAGEDIELASYVFSTDLSATEPLVGQGKWTATGDDNSLTFDNDMSALTTVRNLGFGENYLRWTVSNGKCPDNTDELVIRINEVWIPTGFSPNGDPFNQAFVIDGITEVENELIVFDVNGVEVYRMKNYDNSWEGKDMQGNDLPEGTYFYVITVGGGYDDKYSGYIVLKR